MKLPKTKKQIFYWFSKIGSMFGLSAFLAVGLYLGLQSWDKQLYVQVKPSHDRRIAGQEEDSLYSVSLQDISSNSSDKIFKNSKSVNKDGSIGFYLGNFLIPNTINKGYEFVCQQYKFIEVSFVALGVSFNGDTGTMLVQAPCIIEDENLIGPTWLPVQQMLNNSSKKYFNIAEEKKHIQLYDISFPLVSKWLLTSVRFFNSSDEEGLVVVRQLSNDAHRLIIETQKQEI